ncbi:ubiquitin-like protein Pup [soil metagenome]
MPQEQIGRAHSEQEEVDAREVAKKDIKTEGLDEDVDAILDEIDEVLEVNAEDFVKGFIQKGGQ